MRNLNKTSLIKSYPFDESADLIDLSMIAVNFNRKNHYINSLLYQKTHIKGSNIYVDNLNSKRRTLVRRLYNEIVNQLTFSGIRESKISYNFSRFIQFIRWCDCKGIHNCLDNDKSCIDAINLYADFCWEQVAFGKNKASTISSKLNVLVSILKTIVNENLHQYLPKVKVSIIDRELTFPPDDIHASENIQILQSVINGAHDFITQKKTYPYAWKTPEFLNIHENIVWIFPIRSWCQTKLNDNGTTTRVNVNSGFNYKYGRVVTPRELGEIGINDRETQKRIISRSTLVLKKTNESDRGTNLFQKQAFLRDAISSFAFLLIANTGMNPTQLLNIKWNENYNIQKESIDFCLIKYRAFNKKVHFRITNKFLPTFKKYLDLRNHYLLGARSDYLIPSFGEKYESHKDFVYISKNIKSLMLDLGYTKGLITAREWRCLKSEWLINNTDPSIASKFLQNSERTILNHYTSGTFTRQAEDLTAFLTKLISFSTVTDSPYKSSTAVGGCKEPDKPVNIFNDLAFKSDCRQPEGCLFCENYLIHADENDLRKLLSCKYCIEHTQVLSRTYDDWHTIYDPVLLRIEQIVSYISEINASLVERVKHEVYIDGNLDSYWEGKLEMLINLGAITNEN